VQRDLKILALYTGIVVTGIATWALIAWPH